MYISKHYMLSPQTRSMYIEYTQKCIHTFCAFFGLIHNRILPISFRVTSLALGQIMNNSPYASKAILKNVGTETTLTHWGRVMHMCVSNLTIIGSDNGLSPGRRQAIIWTNAGIVLIGTRGTNFSEILIKIYTFSFKKMHSKMSSGKWRPFCLSLNVSNLNQNKIISNFCGIYCIWMYILTTLYMNVYTDCIVYECIYTDYMVSRN